MRDTDPQRKRAFIMKMAGAVAGHVAMRWDEPERVAKVSVDIATRIYERVQSIEADSVFVHDGRKGKPLATPPSWTEGRLRPTERKPFKPTDNSVNLAIVRAQKLLDSNASAFVEPEALEMAETILGLAQMRDDIIKELERMNRGPAGRGFDHDWYSECFDNLRSILGQEA